MSDFTRRMEDFKLWLTERGAIFKDLTSEYEVIRYQDPVDGTCIAYVRKNGQITLPPAVAKHFNMFERGLVAQKFDRPRGKDKRSLKDDLLERDGETCFYCGDFLDDDCTLEHLLSISRGGNNDPANLCLAHEVCNLAAANLSIAEKVELRDRTRGNRNSIAPWESNKINPNKSEAA